MRTAARSTDGTGWCQRCSQRRRRCHGVGWYPTVRSNPRDSRTGLPAVVVFPGLAVERRCHAKERVSSVGDHGVEISDVVPPRAQLYASVRCDRSPTDEKLLRSHQTSLHDLRCRLPRLLHRCPQRRAGQTVSQRERFLAATNAASMSEPGVAVRWREREFHEAAVPCVRSCGFDSPTFC